MPRHSKFINNFKITKFGKPSKESSKTYLKNLLQAKKMNINAAVKPPNPSIAYQQEFNLTNEYFNIRIN